ncbi:maternal embryonic leucine zipper kinase-like [Homarus americanus]|uniref:maternal embryonic leucine zipper kinase-like n=1 Tax=Homarus americanus TaxID=6706 RepID=UPI001C48B898|nr:maternal embryonic leucine zipper kinase-like [Homarus americanus]
MDSFREFESDPFMSSSSSCHQQAADYLDYPFPRISYEKITIVEDLGVGVFGLARLVNLEVSYGETIVAVLKTSLGDQSLMSEAMALHELNGAGGAPILYGVTSEDPQGLVMEYCPGLTLDHFLTSRTKRSCQKVYGAIQKALIKFHARGYAHMDIHPGNIVIDDSSRPFKVHIIDLGSAARLTNDRKGEAHDLCSLTRIQKVIKRKCSDIR